jgi:hypothetical protein
MGLATGQREGHRLAQALGWPPGFPGAGSVLMSANDSAVDEVK